MPVTVIFRALTPKIRVLCAYSLAQFPHPNPRPGEFHTQNRQPDWDDHNGGTGRHYHYDTYSQNCAAGREDYDPPRNFVGDSGCFIHRLSCP